MYKPPMTDAQVLNVVTGVTRPFLPDQVQALMLFTSDAEVAHLEPLLKAIPGVSNFETWDGQGTVCPPIEYGNDGRRVNCYSLTYTDPNGGSPVEVKDNFGILLAQQCLSSGWNWGRQKPYNKLFIDQTPVAIQINWGHD